MSLPSMTRLFSPPERTRIGFRASSPSNIMAPAMSRGSFGSWATLAQAISSRTVFASTRLETLVCS